MIKDINMKQQDYNEKKSCCDACESILTAYHGSTIIGYVCGNTYENLPLWLITPPCERKGETDK